MLSPRLPLRHAHKARRQAGFSLLEALIALLVISFGMLGIASFQYTLSRSADTAKQRTEATRIAQRELDQLRSFAQRHAEAVPDPNRLTYVEDVVSAGPTAVAGLSTNTTYSLERVVTTPTDDRFRWVNVIVSWADRSGEPQQIRLASAISDGDPAALGVLGVTRRTSTTLRPKKRKFNAPFPMVNLAGGLSSAFAAPTATGNVVFAVENLTARVTQRCTGAPALTEGIDLVASGATCVTIDAYLLSGYVRFKLTGAPATAASISNPSDLTDEPLPLLDTVFSGSTITQQPLEIDSGSTGIAPSRHECYSQIQFTALSTSGGPDITLVEGDPLPAGYLGAGVPHFIAYTCIVTPIDHDSNASTPRIWSGEVRLLPTAVWRFRSSGTLGPSGGRGRLCRFSSDYNGSGTLANSEHPRYYRHVSGSLENQNYLVVNGDDSCPADVASDPGAGDFVDTNTERHQPNPQLSTFEPTSASTTIPME
jgi:Tfp pilus assembly protein PilV